MFKKVLKVVGAVVGVAVVSAVSYAAYAVHTFDSSMDKVYSLPLSQVVRSSDPAVLARGKHLAESIGGCASKDCHGNDLGGGKPLEMGPLGTLQGPNLTTTLKDYSDGELARLLLSGVKRDGRSVQFMDVKEFNWWSEADMAALISYLRGVPVVDRPNGAMELGVLAKILDRQEMLTLDIARRVAHAPRDVGPAPAPTKDYGAFVIRTCKGCHGDGLSGGRIPGAPPSMPVPKNLTLHETGLRGWNYADFNKLLSEGVSKSGAKLDPFMPLDLIKNMSDIEKQAMWAYLESLPPAPFGRR
jgi:cytochrome c553